MWGKWRVDGVKSDPDGMKMETLSRNISLVHYPASPQPTVKNSKIYPACLPKYMREGTNSASNDISINNEEKGFQDICLQSVPVFIYSANCSLNIKYWQGEETV